MPRAGTVSKDPGRPKKYAMAVKAKVLNAEAKGYTRAHITKLFGVDGRTVTNWLREANAAATIDARHPDAPQPDGIVSPRETRDDFRKSLPDRGRDAFKRATAYCHDVLDGRRPSGELEKLTVLRFLEGVRAFKGRGRWRFDKEAACGALGFAESMKFSKGDMRGEPVVLAGWQALVMAELAGWRLREDPDIPRYQTGVVFVPRQNGKTLLVSTIALHALSDSKGAEVIMCAGTENQAKIALNYAIKQTRASAEVMSDCAFRPMTKEVVDGIDEGRLFAIPADRAGSADGFSTLAACCDEIHSWRNSGTWDAMVTGQGALKSSQVIGISTAGTDVTSFGHQMFNYAKEVLRGTAEDERFYAAIWAADQSDEWNDPLTLEKANPSWSWMARDNILSAMELARRSPARRASFRSKHLNLWQNALAPWLLTEDVEKCVNPDAELSDLKGRQVFAGADFASFQDLTAIAYCAVIEGVHHFRIRAFLSAEGASTLPNGEQLVEDGRLILAGEKTTDHDECMATVLEDAADFSMSHAYFDKAMASSAMSQLSKGLPDCMCVSVPQTCAVLNEPMQSLGKLIRDGRVVLEADDLTVSHLLNTGTFTDRTDRVRPSRPDPTRKIDIAAAMIMAHMAWMKHSDDEADSDSVIEVIDFGRPDIKQPSDDPRQKQPRAAPVAEPAPGPSSVRRF